MMHELEDENEDTVLPISCDKSEDSHADHDDSRLSADNSQKNYSSDPLKLGKTSGSTTKITSSLTLNSSSSKPFFPSQK